MKNKRNKLTAFLAIAMLFTGLFYELNSAKASNLITLFNMSGLSDVSVGMVNPNLGIPEQPHALGTNTFEHLDPTFNGTGAFVQSIGVGPSQGFDSALQSDGKIVVAGTAHLGNSQQVLVVRYHPDGSLDTTFGIGGRVVSSFQQNNSVSAQAVKIQPNGQIVIAGAKTTNSTSTTVMLVARYNSDGSIDTTFGVNGIFTEPFAGPTAVARDLLIEPDGKIVVVGNGRTFFAATTDFAAFRLNSDGTADTNFGTNGKTSFDFSFGGDEAMAVIRDPDGKFVLTGNCIVSGSGTIQIAVARLNSDGTLDNSFGASGKVITGHGGSGIGTFAGGVDVALQSDGKIVIGGNGGTAPQFTVVRLFSNGSVDASVRTTILAGTNTINAIKVLPDGKIMAVGSTGNSFGGEDFAALRFNSDLTLDTDFSGDGKVRRDFGTGSDIPNSFHVLPTGHLILVGSAFDQVDQGVALLKYDEFTDLDPSFDNDGMRVDRFGVPASSINSLAVQTDGKVLAAGFGEGEFSEDMFVFRFNTDGTLDNTFNGNGIVSIDFLNNNDRANAIKLQPDGKILVAGSNASTLPFILVRLNSNGTLDSTFASGG